MFRCSQSRLDKWGRHTHCYAHSELIELFNLQQRILFSRRDLAHLK
jgi:hypothetical protein